MTAAERPPELSIVIPCFNEEENVRAICAAVTAEAERHVASHEIIFIDNRSTDATRDILREMCAEDGRVRAIFNTRNYGQMRSPTHGIYQATGEAVIGMCADFQDPPALIGELVRLWRGGAKIVLGQRRSEQTGPLLGLIRKTGYTMLAQVADYPIIPNATGFGLFDRVVVDELARWHEPEPFFRGMVVETGYPIALVPFDRPPRAAGETKNGPAALLAFALSGLAGSAKTLLRAPMLLAVAIAVLAVIAFAAALVAILLGGPALVLAALGLALAMFAVLLLFLGLIGDQVRLIAERSRGAPLVIEEARLNFPPREERV
ncbi:glycosyltransferase family 2 protein [Sphingomonas sp. PL20]|uniref:glycosyltransferase family 2 protein n=1 Tax=Sphingomonas sp. PL20 TaxID=2760712 RepID=UPI001AE1BED6